MKGDEIRAARKALDWTQTELADKAGIKQGYLSAIENGEAIPTFETLDRIAHALGLKVVVTLQPEAAAVSAA